MHSFRHSMENWSYCSWLSYVWVIVFGLLHVLLSRFVAQMTEFNNEQYVAMLSDGPMSWPDLLLLNNQVQTGGLSIVLRDTLFSRYNT